MLLFFLFMNRLSELVGTRPPDFAEGSCRLGGGDGNFGMLPKERVVDETAYNV